jgi:hypothetical protein
MATIAGVASPTVHQSAEQDEVQRTGYVSANRESRQRLNMQILEASAKVSIKAGDQSQAVLFRSAIDHINGLLAPELGPDALQGLAVSQDNSPEATAERILSISTGFLEGYARQHPGEDPEKLATDFVATIRKGFEKGFNEAKDILEGLGVFGGAVKEGVMKTWDLVQKGYDDFLAGKLAANKENAGTVEV